MALLDELVQKSAAKNLETIFNQAGILSTKIHPINRQPLKEVTLAQWLLESGRATSDLAVKAYNFAGLKWRYPDMNGFATVIKIKVPSELQEVEFCQFKDIDAYIMGYWKFLTRSPYAGLEDHTHAPETFIGFLQRKGYAADPGYVNKVIGLLPEAQQLLATTRGITVTLPSVQLQVIRAPQEVEVGQNFGVEGVASPSDKGKVLLLEIDDRFPSKGAAIGQDGKWQIDFVFHQAGDRKMEIAVGNETTEIFIKAVPSANGQDDEETPNPSGKVAIKLTKSVGVGVFNNNKHEVKAVKQRLRDLGYTWVGNPDSVTIDTGTVKAIKLFQSIIAGRSTVAGDGRIDVGGPTHQWLQAANAPRWVAMPFSDPSIGFINFERDQTNDQHDFGTDWLADTVLAIAKDYQVSYRNANPGAAPFAINDISLPHGGDTPDHAGHETGLMCDVYLPRTDGKFGGIYWWDDSYDQRATRALIKSMRKHKLIRAVFFNDPQLIQEKLCTRVEGHDHHIHFEINLPVRA